MCGIAGIIAKEGCKKSRETLHGYTRQMIEKIRSRGPEAVVIKAFSGGKCHLAHARLRVTDENTRSDQPYETSSKRWKLVFNGEIYNYKELDEQLKQTGWRAKTKGDTERLAEILEHCGTESLHSLDGMFALSAFDEKTNCLLMARDRFGQKPLYYIDNEEIFAFASELKALLPLSKTMTMKINAEAMSEYFRLRYIHAPNTCIEQIKKLEPGQYAIIDSHGKMHLDRFFTPSKNGKISSNDYDYKGNRDVKRDPEKLIDFFIKKSIKETVPEKAGMIVSGGIDSTLVAAYTHAQDEADGVKNERDAYTLKLEHQPKEESEWAKRLTERWGWNHQTITVTDRQLVNAYMNVSQRIDEPIGDRSLLPSWILAQAIQPHQRVAIGGDGGDEIFMGYERYQSIGRILDKIPEENWAKVYWQNGLRVGEPSSIDKADISIGIQPMKNIYKQMNILQLQYNNGHDFLQMLDLTTYLPGAVLAKADRTSMDWGLELRSPLLNTQLALSGLTLTKEVNIQGDKGKQILQKLLTQKTGSTPIGKKQGFGAAIAKNSEIEKLLQHRIIDGMKKLKENRQDSKITRWLTKYINETNSWSQNAIFSLAIWIDWAVNALQLYQDLELE